MLIALVKLSKPCIYKLKSHLKLGSIFSISVFIFSYFDTFKIKFFFTFLYKDSFHILQIN
jgi:hypothetical protein